MIAPGQPQPSNLHSDAYRSLPEDQDDLLLANFMYLYPKESWRVTYYLQVYTPMKPNGYL